MANIVLTLLSALAGQARANFIRKTRHPLAVQERFLKSLLHYHRGTVFAQAYGLADIKTIDQFRDRMPILPYSSYEPYIERLARGEANILNPDPVVYLNLTSGSTGKQKLIPVTRRSRQALNKINQVSIGFAMNAAKRQGKSLGKMLLTSSVQHTGLTTGGIPYGPVSASSIRLTNSFYRQIFAHPFEALLPAESLARHYICLLFSLRDPSLAVIGATFPVMALRLCDYLECYADDLIQDLEMGTIADWLNLDSELRAKLKTYLAPSPHRARQLRQILKSEGRLTPQLAWSDLSFIITARGGTSNFYFERFPTYFGDTPVFGGVYASSETTFGTYHDFNDDGAILALESGFFEFIPSDQWNASHPKTLLANEVTVGEQYRVLVTNYSGLYRYDIGDVVEVVGFYENTPLITFRHRLGGLLSSTTEKTTEFHAIQVMQWLQQAFNVSLENFCITLSEHDFPAHYLVNIELATGQQLDDPLAFLVQFDRKLTEVHTSYGLKRPDQVPPPRLRILQPGSFGILRQRLLQRGIPESQLKFPHISEDRKLLAGLPVQQEIRLPEDDHWQMKDTTLIQTSSR